MYSVSALDHRSIVAQDADSVIRIRITDKGNPGTLCDGLIPLRKKKKARCHTVSSPAV